jgi:hypothetical protein
MSVAGMHIRDGRPRIRRESSRAALRRALAILAYAIAMAVMFAGFFEVGRSTRSTPAVPQLSYASQALRAKSVRAGIPERLGAAAPIPAPVASRAAAAPHKAAPEPSSLRVEPPSHSEPALAASPAPRVAAPSPAPPSPRPTQAPAQVQLPSTTASGPSVERPTGGSHSFDTSE